MATYALWLGKVQASVAKLSLLLYSWCHGSAWTPLSADNQRKARRLEETHTEART
jgi:hypothetical protein